MGIEAHKVLPLDSRHRVSFLDRMHARVSGMRTQVTGFVYQPEPRRLGSFAKGRQMAAGNFQIAGHVVQQPGTPIWDLAPPDPGFVAELHGFTWLDDLAAAGSMECRVLAQEAVMTWIDRFGAGKGDGWSPDQTGRRLIRWINHAIFLMNGQEGDNNARYFSSLGRQACYLSRRWQVASAGLPRFEALTGLLYAGISLNGVEHLVAPAAKALARECKREIDPQGGVPTRNPEELLEIFTLLSWAAQAVEGAGRTPGRAHLAAIERITPTLSALHHADGALARFHGGSRGPEGRFDQVLGATTPNPLQADQLAMGFAHLNGGQASVIMDAAPPPDGKASRNGHASTLAFELTSGRQPLIVNCGSGASFGAEWRRAGRATPSHSTLSIKGISTARLGQRPEGEVLTGGPRHVAARQEVMQDGMRIVASHDAYRKTYGLTHVRQLDLSHNGHSLRGTDTFSTLTRPDKDIFDGHMNETAFAGVEFAIRFHLHPDADASLDMGGTAVSLTLKSGEVWVFRCQGEAEMAIKPSVFLEKARLKPRPSQQIVLSSRVMEYGARVGWVLAKAKDF